MIMILSRNLIKEERGRMHEDTATKLLGLPGMRVVEVDDEADGGLTVYVVAADTARTPCPVCGMLSRSSKETTPIPVRDVMFGDRLLTVVWLKRRLVCPSPACDRQTFVEVLPEVATRGRITNRLRRLRQPVRPRATTRLR